MFVSFNVSGATGTAAQRINDSDVITRWYYLGNVPHGFLRNADGCRARQIHLVMSIFCSLWRFE
jgi:hypothetical protein